MRAAAEAADSYASGPYQNGRYEYEPYNLGKMDPQLTGWPLSSAARAFCNIAESSRWPGKEPGGTGQTAANMAKIPTTPGAQGGDWWLKNHENLVGVVDRYIRDRGTRVDVLLLGDSITQQWLGFSTPFSGYDVAAKMQPFNAAWKSNFPGLTAVSLGVAGDRTQSLLWRLDHDGPRTLEPRVVVVAIGHNNMFFTGPTRESNPGATGTDAAARGVLCVVQNVLARFPNSKVLVVKVLPCFDQNAAFYKQAQLINSQIDTLNLESHPRVHLLDSLLVNVLEDRPMWDAWVDATGNPKPELFRTGAGEPVHPSQDQGYSLYASKLKGPVQHLLNQPGTFYFSAPEFTAAENAGEIRLAVRRLSGGSGPASVEFQTGDGTAIAGTDYLATSGVLSWKEGETADKFVTIRLKDNVVPNPDRTLQISLRNPQGETLGVPASTVVRIQDDEQPGQIGFTPGQTLQAFENGGPLTLRVQRSAGRSGAATVQYAVTGGSALDGSDFTAVTGTLRWENGDANEKEVVVPILDDSNAEPVENFRVVLSGASGAALGGFSQLDIEILDEDPSPLNLYAEGLASGWFPNGWSSTTNPLSSGDGVPPRTGTKVCAATITGVGGAAGFFYQAAGGLDLRTYQSVTFWLHGGTQGGQSLKLMPYSSTPSAGKLLSPPLTAGMWQKYTVTLAELSQINASDLNALRFVDQGGASVGRTFYMDDIQLDLRPAPTGALPSVATLAPAEVFATGATLAGNAPSAGDSPIISKGLCWSLTRNPTRADPRTDAGAGPGEFRTPVGGLSPGSRYHVRAYAVSTIGTAYGENREFTLPPPAGTPVPGPTSASVSGSQTVLEGSVESDGGMALIQRGFAWGAIAKPMQEWTLTQAASPLYTATLSGLNPATEYGARAYALNDAGLSYGPVTRFTAPRAGNLPPVASPMALVTLEDQPLLLTLAGTDSDGSIASYAVAAAPINGALSGTPPNLVYTPASNFNGSDTFTFTVTDAQGATSTPATVTLSVSPVNDAPGFTKGANQSVPFNSPARTIPGWATGIHPGAPDESAQTLIFQVSNNNPALFSVAPALAANGTLSFTPAPGKSGTATVTVLLKDNGGVSNGGKDSSLPQSFDITIGENTKPVASPMALVTLEDQPLPLTLAGTDSDGSIASYAVAAAPINGTLSGTPPNLVYTPASNFNGSDTFTFTVTDAQGATSTAATVTLSVTPVNDAPGFTRGANQSVPFNSPARIVPAWATGIHPGAPDESAQTLAFQVSNNNPALFSAAPALAANGTLSFTPAQGKSGTATLTVVLKDSGGVSNGGKDSSLPQSFDITIGENTKPVATPMALATLEDQPLPLTLAGTDSDGSIASYAVASGPINGALSGTPPNLVYTPASNFNGSDTFTFTVTDAQGATSTAATVSLSVTPVNDAPGFTKGPNPIVGKNAGPQTVRNWASMVHAGPENESGQGVTLSVSTTSPDLFSAPPQLDTEGTLTFTPARNKAGSALVTVLIQDNGGQENGGQDSFECSFEIRITEIFKASGIYSGLVRSADGPNSLSSTGFIRVSIARTGALSGRILVGGVSTAFTGKFDDSGIPRFGSRKLLELPLATRRRPAPLLSLRMELDQTPIVMRGGVRIGDNPLSILEALRELGSIRPLTAEEKGAFSLPSNRTYYLGAPVANAGNPEASRPHGHGHGVIRSFAGGSVRMAGVMADGRSISASAAIQENGSWPLYAVPAGSSGALFGTVQVRSLPGSSDMDSACLQWFMPENPRRSAYRTGWPAGLTLDLRAAVYRAPVRMAREGALTGAGAPRTEGNAQLRIGPDQGESLWRHALNVDAASKVWIQAPNALRLTVDPKTGFWRGSYLHPEIRKWVPFRGVIQQESRIGAGMEWGMEGSRPVVLEPTPQLAAPGPSNVP